MAYTKKGVGDIHYIVDTKDDLNTIENPNMGSTAWVVHEAAEYMADSKGEWIPQTAPSNGGDANAPDLSNYASIDYVNSLVESIEIPDIDPTRVQHAINYLVARNRDYKFAIGNVPKGTIIDYRDKEIRIFVSDISKLVRQEVGPTGDNTKYYIPFYAYAPVDAVTFKEGDKGVVVDEIHTFDEDFSGVDTFGRKYSVVWLAIASYNEAYNTWTYYGTNSKADDMIGWDYVVEWYDADNALIGMDSMRINLSNKDCHLAYADCYK